MNNQDYEKAKTECWLDTANYCGFTPTDPIKHQAFNSAFDRAYALGKEEKDAEGEEMLTCNKGVVQALYLESLKCAPKLERWKGIKWTLGHLFGSKCLPDNVATSASNVDTSHGNVESLEPKPAEPKFKVGDKVECLRNHHIYVIRHLDFDDGIWWYNYGNPAIWIKESDLEPCTEPKKASPNVNHSDINIDELVAKGYVPDPAKQFDTIIKDSFRNERRLNIATQIISAILSNQKMLNNLAHGETTADGVVRCVVDSTMMYTDALISECELTDKLKGE